MPPEIRTQKKAPIWRTSAFLKYGTVFFITALCLLLYFELHYAEVIVSAPEVLPGNIPAEIASGLVIQHIDDDARVWGVQGYQVYESTDGLRFEKAFRVPSGNLLSWLGNFHTVRKISGLNELCEVMPLRSGTILAFAGGYFWRSTDGGGHFEKVHKVECFGHGRGRGIMPEGLAEDRDGVVYYGEYHRNTERGPVHIYRSLDDGKTWQVAYRFAAGAVRHVHSLSIDPYTNALWATTGDRDEESMIVCSFDKGETFQTVGSGSQQWRTVDLLFAEDSVYWGTDSPEDHNWIYRMDRASLDVERICQVDGPIYYATALCDGTLVMGSAVEGRNGGEDGTASIWLSRDGQQWIQKPLTRRKSPRRQAVLRLARGSCGHYLLVTPLNTGSYSEDLLMVDVSECFFP